MIPLPLYFYILLQLLYISYIDFKTRKISNIWIIANILTFIIVQFIFPNEYSFSMDAFYFTLAFLFVGLLLFALKIMGAGDTKYLASFFLLVPISMQDTVFIKLAYSTLVVGIVLFAYNTLWNLRKIRSALILMNVDLIKDVYGRKFAYSPVILLTWIWIGIVLWQNFFVKN